MKLTYFINIDTIETLKIQYKKLAKINHPDLVGGDCRIMQIVNNEYEYLFKKYCNIHNTKTSKEVNEELEIDKIFMDKINEIILLEGLIIELVGRWIWVTGETYKYRNELKKSHFIFASKKIAWFFRYEEDKTKNHKEMSLDEIKNKYNTKTFNSKLNFQLS